MPVKHVKLVTENGKVVDTGIPRFYEEIRDLGPNLVGRPDYDAIAFLAQVGYEVLTILEHPVQRPSKSQQSEGRVVRRGGSAQTEQVWIKEIWMIRRQ